MCASVIKQYDFVAASGRWCLVAGKQYVWRRTDHKSQTLVFSIYGLKAWEREMSTCLCSLSGVWYTLPLHTGVHQRLLGFATIKICLCICLFVMCRYSEAVWVGAVVAAVAATVRVHRYIPVPRLHDTGTSSQSLGRRTHLGLYSTSLRLFLDSICTSVQKHQNI